MMTDVLINSRNVFKLLDELWIVRGIEAAYAMRLRSLARQCGETLAPLTPSLVAIARVLECTATTGLLSLLCAIRRATSILSGGALRGRSRSIPARRDCAADIQIVKCILK